MDIAPPSAVRGTARQRLRLLATAAVIGLIAAVGVVLFLGACQAVTRFALTGVVGYRPGEPAGEKSVVASAEPGRLRVLLLVPVAAAGGLVTGWIVSRIAPEAGGPGADGVIRAYHEPDGRIQARVPLLKILTTAATIGTGGSGGREGPMVQIGAGLGFRLAEWFGFDAAGRRVLLAAGMGAGVAAVFRTPLAGALFAAEVLYRSEDMEPEVLLPAGVAAVSGAAAAGLVLGWGPILPAGPIGPASLLHVPAYGVLVVALVILARLYVAAYHGLKGWFRRLRLPGTVKPALGAATAALVGVALYYGAGEDRRVLSVLGFGLEALQDALLRPEGLTAGLLGAVALGKLATTALTVGSDGSGGVFGPAVVIGGCAGGAIGLALQPLGPEWAPPATAFVLLGMAGLFTAAAKVPFSTLVIVCEMTGGFALLGPGLAVCLACFLLSGQDSLFPSQPFRRADSPVHRSAGSESELATEG